MHLFCSSIVDKCILDQGRMTSVFFRMFVKYDVWSQNAALCFYLVAIIEHLHPQAVKTAVRVGLKSSHREGIRVVDRFVRS